jgi:acyl-CoA synthetase (AMP-forming)/AMP-acid ligase II
VTTWRSLFAGRVDDAPAIHLDAGRCWSAAELVARAAGATAWLERLGVHEGEPVAGLLTATPASLALTLAGALWNRPLAPLGPRMTADEISHCVRGLGARLLVADPEFVDVARSVGDAIGVRAEVLPDEFLAADRELAADPDPEAIVGYLHTSGTTGLPKQVPMRERRLGRRTHQNATALHVGPGSVYATAAGFHHIAGLGMILVLLGAGGSVAPFRSFSIESWRKLGEVHPTHALLVPSQIEILLDAGALELSSLEVLQYGASPIHPDTLRAALATLPRVRFLQIYGQTEGSPIAMLDLDAHRRALDGEPTLLASCGRAVPGLELELGGARDDGVGEVRARADHLFAPGPDGWLATGDLGRLDDEGFLFLVGRQGDRIIRGGENVYPLEIERVLESHPQVAEAAVVGFRDRRLGERIAAFVVVRADADTPSDETLVGWCRDRMAHFKVPERWQRVDALPRNAAGKLLRRALDQEQSA